MSWFALYTRPKNEKKVTEQLTKLGIEVYCPLVTQVKQWSDERNKVFEVHGVVRYLFWLGKPAAIRDEEIEALKNSLKGVMSSVEVAAIKPGDTINISTGPFQGKEGVVSQVGKNQIRLVLKELGVMITLTREEGL